MDEMVLRAAEATAEATQSQTLIASQCVDLTGVFSFLVILSATILAITRYSSTHFHQRMGAAKQNLKNHLDKLVEEVTALKMKGTLEEISKILDYGNNLVSQTPKRLLGLHGSLFAALILAGAGQALHTASIIYYPNLRPWCEGLAVVLVIALTLVVIWAAYTLRERSLDIVRYETQCEAYHDTSNSMIEVHIQTAKLASS